MTEVQQAFYRLAPHIVDLTVDDDGVIEYADRRFVFFHTAMFARLFDRMKEVTGPVIESRIQEFGEEAGEQIASKMDDAFQDAGVLDLLRLLVRSGFDLSAVRQIARDDTRTRIEKIFGLGTYDGWVGDITVTAYEEGSRMVVSVENTFESASYGETGEAECRFLRGVLKGILTFYWDIDGLQVEETACRCAGDDACTMVVTHDT